jgi:hypothetical protein
VSVTFVDPIESDPIPIVEAPNFSSPALNRPNGAEPLTRRSGQVAADQGSVTPSWAPEHDAEILRSVAEAALRPTPSSIPDLIPAETRFVREQEWVGRVDAVGEEYFSATLIDMMGWSDSDEGAHISWQLVSDHDVELVQPGALFYWVIGYRISPTERRGESRLIFRRSRPWTPSEERRAKAEAETLWQHFAPPAS